MSDAPISAASRGAAPTTDSDLGLRPCLLVDLLWEQFAEGGADAAAEGRAAEAAALWEVTVRLAEAFAADDPRRAAALGAAAADEARLGAALAAWEAAAGWVERMAAEHKPRSSLFHHRLEEKHPGAYAEVARAGYRRLAAAGRAGCLGKLAGLLRDEGRVAAAEPLYREAIAARTAGLGARDEGVIRLVEGLADLLDAAGRGREAGALRDQARTAAQDPVTARARWRRDRPARMNDARRLLAAAYLMPISRRR